MTEAYDIENPIYFGYEDMVDSIGEIVQEISLGTSEGDLLFLIRGKENKKWGYVGVGYGSCAGCDAYQACSTNKELQSLRDDIENSTRWFDNSTEAIDFFVNHDWKGDYFGRDPGLQEFIQRCQDAILATIHPN